MQAFLSSMSTYYLTLFKLPTKTAKSLDKLTLDLFWEGSGGDEGMHNVKWETA